jgi:hypothetical protein
VALFRKSISVDPPCTPQIPARSQQFHLGLILLRLKADDFDGEWFRKLPSMSGHQAPWFDKIRILPDCPLFSTFAKCLNFRPPRTKWNPGFTSILVPSRIGCAKEPTTKAAKTNKDARFTLILPVRFSSRSEFLKCGSRQAFVHIRSGFGGTRYSYFETNKSGTPVLRPPNFQLIPVKNQQSPKSSFRQPDEHFMVVIKLGCEIFAKSGFRNPAM